MKEQTLNQFKELYELEKFLIKYYDSRLSSNEDTILNKALSKMTKINKSHLAYYDQLFVKTHIDKSIIANKIADFAGNLVGESIELTGPKNICQVAVILERKALKLYYTLTKERSLDLDIFDRLIDFQLDKEFHILWLQHYANFLKQDCNNLLNNTVEEHPTVNVNMRLI